MMTEIRDGLRRAASKRKTGPFFIVDDDEDDRRMMTREIMFLFGDQKIETFANGTQLLDRLKAEAKKGEVSFKKNKPRIILLDLKMPGMGGLPTLRALQDDPQFSKIPVVMISGSDSTDIAAASKDGASAAMPKPFSKNDWVFF